MASRMGPRMDGANVRAWPAQSHGKALARKRNAKETNPGYMNCHRASIAGRVQVPVVQVSGPATLPNNEDRYFVKM